MNILLFLNPDIFEVQLKAYEDELLHIFQEVNLYIGIEIADTVVVMSFK